MSKVYKPINLVETENDYKKYAVVVGNGKNTIFLNNSEELKELFEECTEDEISVYALQTVARAEEVDSYDDDDDDEDYEDAEIEETQNDITQDIEKIAQTLIGKFIEISKEAVSEIVAQKVSNNRK